MKTVVNVSVLAVAAATLVGCAATGGGGAKSKWQCSAQGLVNAHYTGSNHAKIHLKGYRSGGKYAVTKNAAGTEAKGVTGNGTPFTCTKVAQ